MPRIADEGGAAAMAAVLRGAVVGASLRRAEGGRPRSARDPEGLSSMSVLPTTEDLEALFAALVHHRIDAVLVGGIAMLRYVDGRNTEDVDLIVREEAVRSVPGFVLLDRNADAARGRFRSIRVDMLSPSTPVFALVASRHATSVMVGGNSIRCATPHGLAVLKLFALPNLYRLGRLARAALYETDLLALHREAGVDLVAAVAELVPYMGAGDLEAIRGVVEEINARARRMERRAGPGGAR